MNCPSPPTASQPDRIGNDLDTDLPEILVRWRRERDLKIATAASGMGVAAATWGHWERGTRFPNGRNLDLLSRYTGLPVRALLCSRFADCPFRPR